MWDKEWEECNLNFFAEKKYRIVYFINTRNMKEAENELRELVPYFKNNYLFIYQAGLLILQKKGNWKDLFEFLDSFVSVSIFSFTVLTDMAWLVIRKLSTSSFYLGRVLEHLNRTIRTFKLAFDGVDKKEIVYGLMAILNVLMDRKEKSNKRRTVADSQINLFFSICKEKNIQIKFSLLHKMIEEKYSQCASL